MAIARWLQMVFRHHDVAFEEHDEPVGPFVPTHLLWDRGRPVAVAMPAAAPLDPARVQEVLGCPELRPAQHAEIAGWFKGCHPTAIPPLRLRGDELLLMDRSAAHPGRISFAAGLPGVFVSMRFRDWWRIARPGVGRFAAEASAAGRPMVLVVEDEDEINGLFCQLLQREGFACRGVHGGQEALAVAATERPAAVLLDLMLPDMSGFELYQRLRCPDSLRRPPVVIVSALDSEDSRQRGRELGADAYLTKPFLPQQLVSEMREAMADALA
jgi:CheY-like chemotaxis protein/prolyl-tRNA editing enzyme YbaK/EbsC (Cys-tRNA(Pro) deacylase)